MSNMYTHRWAARIAVALAPIVTSTWIAACAADVGDTSKTEGLTEGGPGPGVEAGTDTKQSLGQDQASSPPTEDSPSGLVDSGNPGDTTTTDSPSTATDTSTPPVDTGPPPPVDTGPPPPPPADGGGCSAGSTVITATDPSSGSTSGTVGNFGTTGAVCVKLLGGITSQYGGWNSSNVTGRTVTLNGVSVPVGGAQGAVAAGPDGYAIWEWTAGADNYASMSLY